MPGHQGHSPQRSAQGEAARIPHEHLRWVGVVPKEGETRPDDGETEAHQVVLALKKGDHAVGDERAGHDDAREPIQSIGQVSELAREHAILLHTDAAQSIGKIPVPVDTLGIDLLSIAGHKVYAPKGIGALYIRQGVALETFMHGAGQEMGKRASTENVLEIVGLGKACELAAENLEAENSKVKALRDKLEKTILNKCPDCRLNGDPDNRLPNTSNISFEYIVAKRSC